MEIATNQTSFQQQTEGSITYVYLISSVAATGGLLFGFDTAIISGAIEFVREKFQLNAHQEGFAVSSLLIGCIFGSSAAGILTDRFGRKKVLITTAIFFALSAIWSALPRSLTELVLARFLGGMAVGVSSLVSPLYIAEISPARIRGRLVGLNQMAIVTGILVAYCVNWLLVDIGPNNWRWMFGSETLPALILLIGILCVPESPRWLLTRNREKEALGVLTRVNGYQRAQTEMEEIKTTIAEEQGSLSELFQPGLRIALLVGVTLAILSQITGINTIIYYGPKIFLRAGYPEASSAFWASVLVGTTNFASTILSLWLIDRIGRKPLLLIGSAGMAVCLVLAELALPAPGLSTTSKLLPILGYVAFFSVGLGVTVWVLIAEIFPTRIRGRAMSMATMSLWVACFAVSQTFPYLIERFEEQTFRIYAILCVVMVLFVSLVVNDTKGKSLEEIERMWH